MAETDNPGATAPKSDAPKPTDSPTAPSVTTGVRRPGQAPAVRRPGAFAEPVRRPGQFAPPAAEPEAPSDDLYPVVPISGAELRERATDLPALGSFGPYDILGRIALGGMAEILLARRSDDPRPIVVKKILAQYARDDEFSEMFLDEARICSVLDHKNICRFLDSGEIDGQLFISMEWVHGPTLGRMIRRARKSGGLTMPMVAALVARVADALHYAHTARDAQGTVMGLVHRDVSPHNIMVAYDGQVKLLDFGIAKAEVQSHRTQAGVVKGKFAYMAPEQCRGRDVDFRIDIFALGVVFYEALTGKSLYRRQSEMETMRAIVTGPVPSLFEKLESAPRELEAIVKTALAKDPADRFPTAASMRDVLRSYVKRSGENTDDDHIASVVQHLFADELQRGPSVDSTPFGSSFNISSESGARPTAVPPAQRAAAKRVDLETGAPELESLGASLPVPDEDVPTAIGAPLADDASAALGDSLAESLASLEADDAADEAGIDVLVGAPDEATAAVSPDRLLESLAKSRADEPTAGGPTSTPSEPGPTKRPPAPAPSPAPAPRPAPAPAAAGPLLPLPPTAAVASVPNLEDVPVAAKRSTMSTIAMGMAVLVAVLAGVALGMWALQNDQTPVAVEDARASVVVRSTPPGASVVVGERPAQPSPAVFDRLMPGTHDVRVELTGHQVWRGRVMIEAGQSGVVDVNLVPNP